MCRFRYSGVAGGVTFVQWSRTIWVWRWSCLPFIWWNGNDQKFQDHRKQNPQLYSQVHQQWSLQVSTTKSLLDGIEINSLSIWRHPWKDDNLTSRCPLPVWHHPCFNRANQKENRLTLAGLGACPPHWTMGDPRVFICAKNSKIGQEMAELWLFFH